MVKKVEAGKETGKEAVKLAEKEPVAAVEVKAEKPAAKKPAAKKAAAKKPAAKKAAAPKAEKPATESGEEVYVQFGGAEWSVTDLRERAVAAYVADGHRASAVKKLMLYVKPEEGKAFYVINDKTAGSIAL